MTAAGVVVPEPELFDPEFEELPEPELLEPLFDEEPEPDADEPLLDEELEEELELDELPEVGFLVGEVDDELVFELDDPV